jgi:DNA helicase-2/ATP-dependent DNA helicase PcrA
VFGEYQATEPSRFLLEVPAQLVEERESTRSSYWASRQGRLEGDASWADGGASHRARPLPGRPRSAREEPPAYRYEDEDQTPPELRPGLRVRHPHFGVGTVLSVEPGHDDTKLVVRFASVGQKKLMARFARLERA